jgi:hypothetical protein
MRIRNGVNAFFTYLEQHIEDLKFQCRFCGHKIDLEDALKADFSLWATLSNMGKLAEWRRKADDLHQRARSQKIRLDGFYRENEKLMRELHKAEREHTLAPATYNGGFEARCKKCKRLHTIALKLELDAPNFPEELSLEEKMKLKVSDDVLLRVAERRHYPNAKAYKEWLESEEQIKLRNALEQFVSNHLEKINCEGANELKKTLQGFLERVNRELNRRKVAFLSDVQEFVRETLPTT